MEIKTLLKNDFNIHSGTIYISTKPSFHKIRNRLFFSRHYCYGFGIFSFYVGTFASKINFSIKRKQLVLSEIVKQLEERKKNVAIYEQAQTLNRQELPISKIARKLSVHRNTVRGWLVYGHKTQGRFKRFT